MDERFRTADVRRKAFRLASEYRNKAVYVSMMNETRGTNKLRSQAQGAWLSLSPEGDYRRGVGA
jgi:hypothetical protein